MMGLPKIKMNGKGICGIRIMIYPFQGAPPAEGPEESISGGFPWNG
jgi:hypothetical protein